LIQEALELTSGFTRNRQLIAVSCSVHGDYDMQYLAKRPGLLAAVGAVLATGGYVVTRRLLGMKPRNRRKRARPSGRPHKKAG